MSDESGEDLKCQKCPAVFLWRTDDRTTEYAARFKDWKVFQGETEGGGFIRVVLCPADGGSQPRKRVLRHEPIDGQQLFDFDL